MKFRIALLLAIVIALIVPVIALASPGGQGLPGAIDLELQEYFASLGLGFLVPFVIELLKRFKVIPDGLAGTVAMLLNVVLYLVLLVLGSFVLDLDGELAVDVIAILSSIANLILMVLTTIVTFGKLRESQVPFFQPRER